MINLHKNLDFETSMSSHQEQLDSTFQRSISSSYHLLNGLQNCPLQSCKGISNVLGWSSQTHFIPSSTRSFLIHPSSWVCITLPEGNFSALDKLFLFKIAVIFVHPLVLSASQNSIVFHTQQFVSEQSMHLYFQL